jgi:flagellar motility protein MotE (MotC chaperone)
VILDGEVAMLQAQVERLQEQLTESDHDRIANIARLTGQVSELKAKLERQQAYHMDSRQELQEELSKSDAQRDELQRMLTACEEDRDGAREESKARLRSWNDEAERLRDSMRTWANKAKANEDRVRVLEGALKNVYSVVKRSFVGVDSGGRAYAAVGIGAQTRIKGALREHIAKSLGYDCIPGCLCVKCTTPPAETPTKGAAFMDFAARISVPPVSVLASAVPLKDAPPDETPAPADFRDVVTLSNDSFAVDPVLAKSVANEVQRIAAETPARWKVFIPTTDRERMGPELYDRIAGHVSRLESETDRLRAELATANEEIARLTKFLDARNAEIEQFDVRFLRQYAQLGRAVALIRDMRTGFMGDPHKPGCARECCKFVTAANAILADADSKVSK